MALSCGSAALDPRLVVYIGRPASISCPERGAIELRKQSIVGYEVESASGSAREVGRGDGGEGVGSTSRFAWARGKYLAKVWRI